jgi:hypothetical protein
VANPKLEERGTVLPWIHELLSSIHQGLLAPCEATLQAHKEGLKVGLGRGGATGI